MGQSSSTTKTIKNFLHLLTTFWRLAHLSKTTKNNSICHFVHLAKVDMFLTTKNNVAWHKILAKHCLPECMHGWWESLHINMVHNMTDLNSGTYQPGSMGVFSIN